MFFKFSMTIPEYMEYLRLKEKSPKFNEFDLYSAILGSGLCFGKTLAEQLGFNNLSNAFYVSSKVLFWILISVSLIKGIKKTCNKESKNAGIGQLIGTGISAVIMIYH